MAGTLGNKARDFYSLFFNDLLRGLDPFIVTLVRVVQEGVIEGRSSVLRVIEATESHFFVIEPVEDHKVSAGCFV